MMLSHQPWCSNGGSPTSEYTLIHSSSYHLYLLGRTTGITATAAKLSLEATKRLQQSMKHVIIGMDEKVASNHTSSSAETTIENALVHVDVIFQPLAPHGDKEREFFYQQQQQQLHDYSKNTTIATASNTILIPFVVLGTYEHWISLLEWDQRIRNALSTLSFRTAIYNEIELRTVVDIVLIKQRSGHGSSRANEEGNLSGGMVVLLVTSAAVVAVMAAMVMMIVVLRRPIKKSESCSNDSTSFPNGSTRPPAELPPCSNIYNGRATSGSLETPNLQTPQQQQHDLGVPVIFIATCTKAHESTAASNDGQELVNDYSIVNCPAAIASPLKSGFFKIVIADWFHSIHEEESKASSSSSVESCGGWSTGTSSL